MDVAFRPAGITSEVVHTIHLLDLVTAVYESVQWAVKSKYSPSMYVCMQIHTSSEQVLLVLCQAVWLNRLAHKCDEAISESVNEASASGEWRSSGEWWLVTEQELT